MKRAEGAEGEKTSARSRTDPSLFALCFPHFVLCILHPDLPARSHPPRDPQPGRSPAPPTLLAAVLLIGVLTSCSRTPVSSQSPRLAILRFENLTGDASLSWQGRALSEIISTQLQGAPNLQILPSARLHQMDRSMGLRPISAPGISSESAQALAAGATQLGYGQYTVRNGKITEFQEFLDSAALNAAFAPASVGA